MKAGFGKVLGPGLMFAGAAVGVSHLVQSTSAGAVYGLSLLGVIVLANIIKYPAFSFGPRYAAATGTSLLEGYRRQGRWALAIYAVVTVATMFTVEAAVTLVTAALLKAVLGVELGLITLSALLLVTCALICAVGKFAALDKVIRVVVIVLTVSTLVATALVLPRIEWSLSILPGSSFADSKKNLLFLAALIGWMPSAIDVSVWHSLWTLAKRRVSGHAPTVRESLFDFKLGYWGTAFLALCFALLGAGIIFGSGAKVPAAPVAFAQLILDLYAETLGDWARPLIGACAALVMFSTTLTVVDGFPRALTTLVERFRTIEEPGDDSDLERHPVYWGAVVALGGGALLILEFFIADLKSLVDVATTLSFLTAPILALLNHRAMHAEFVPAGHRPGVKMSAYSAIAVALLAGFSLFYLWVRFF